MSSIFISHRSTDNAVAAELAEWLRDRGHHSMFLDYDPVDGIPAGRDWEQELYRQLRACRAVIALCSEESLASRWCFVEITHARALGKPVLPVRIDDCDVHDLIADRQVIDLFRDAQESYERLWHGLLAAGLDPADAFEWDPDRPPYPGLLAFEAQDAPVFFGRDTELTEGLALLHRAHRLASGRPVIVIGASGSGKSSLVRAGLVPRLAKDTTRWIVVEPFRPRDDPLRQLAISLGRAFAATDDVHAPDPTRIAARLGQHDEAGANPLVELTDELRRAAGRPQARVLVVVDQFEELLGVSPEHPAHRFVRLLREAGDAPDSPLALLATMRSDFLADFQREPLVGLTYDTLPVGPLSTEDLVQVIEEPAHIAGVDLETGLSQALLDDSRAQDALPLLAFTLRELWERYADDGTLTIANYRDGLGGLQGSIARVADEVLDAQPLTEEQLGDLRVVFLAMVRMTDDGRWARRSASWADMPDSVRPLLERFVRARLLVVDDQGAGRQVEVAHEALFSAWGLLAGWLDDSATQLRLRHEIEVAGASYRNGGEDPADLWRGTRLARATELLDDADIGLKAEDEAFVRASAAAEHEAKAQASRRRQRVVRGVAIAAAVMSVIAAVAVVLFFRARDESERADEQAAQAVALSLADRAEAMSEDNAALAIAVAAESTAHTDEPTAESLEALTESVLRFDARGWQPTVVLEGHTGTVTAVAVSPDGERVASGGDDTVVRIWDTATGELQAELPGHEKAIRAAVFHPTNSELYTAGEDLDLFRWNTETGELIERREAHTGPVIDLAITTDGSTLLSASGDFTVGLWDLDTGAQPVMLEGHNRPVRSVAVNETGTIAASASQDRTVRRWDLRTGTPLGEALEGHAGWVRDVAFGPGDTLYSVGDDRALIVWDVENPDSSSRGIGHGDAVTAVVVDPAGAVTTGSQDATIRQWDDSSALGDPLTGHRGPVNRLALSADGAVMASSSDDGSVWVWAALTDPAFAMVLEGHDDWVRSVAFDPTGSVTLSGSTDGTIGVWDTNDGSLVGRLAGHTGIVTDVAFAPDGTTFVREAADSTVRLWDGTTGEETRELTGHAEWVNAVSFAPDGVVVASAGDDGTTRLWDVATGEPLHVLAADTGQVTDVEFSPDGTAVVSATADGAIVLWDAESGDEIDQFTGHIDIGLNADVWGVTFSPDGNTLASVGADQTVRLWDVATGEQVATLEGHVDQVRSVAFSPDGATIVSAGDGASILQWDAATAEGIGRPLTGHDGPILGVAFAPGGTTVASASIDTSVRLRTLDLDPAQACEVADPYITDEQLDMALDDSGPAAVCDID